MTADRRRGVRWDPRDSLRVRITSVAVAVVGVVLVLGGLALVWGLHAVLTREATATAAGRAAEAARIVGSGGDAVGAVSGDDVLVQVLDPAGVVQATSADRLSLPLLTPGRSRVVDLPSDDGRYLAVAAAAGRGRTIVVAQSLDPVDEPTRALAALLAAGLPTLLLVVAVVTWRVAGRTLAPVEAIRAEVDAISAAELHRRVPGPATGDEIGRLAGTMNRMLDRLERSAARQRQFVADASHELRSPIAVIREHAEIAQRHPELGAGLAATVHTESLRMQALVDDLLLLAQVDADTVPVRRRPVDLDDLVLAEARRLRDLGGPAVDTRGVSAARVSGDPAALRRVLGNLGDNAARHARSRIALALRQRDGSAELSVEDDGPGVPAADRSRVFDRFVRLDDARARSTGGSGLGLAIVAEILARHGGTVALDDSPLGGARVLVRLPGSTD